MKTRSANENTIDAAIAYVESLELSDIGYSHIEEACLSELNAYKDDGVILESYTVLVPKSKAKYYYGTYLNHDYYYGYTSVSDMRRETNGAESSTNMDSCYQDQTSSLRVKLYFCPVGTAFDSDYIEIDTVYNGSVKANNLTKDEILHAANAYSNHNSVIIYKVSDHRVTEKWGG